MSMMWVKKQSKWVVVAAAVLIGGSLILMDLPSSQGMTSEQSVGEVDGVEIPTAAFQQELQGYIRAEESQTGRPPEGVRYAEIRDELFQTRLQGILFDRLTRTYKLRASAEEMHDWLLRNPLEVGYALAQYEGPEAVPTFLRDSTFNPMAFQAWLSQDSVYDRPGLRALEQRLKSYVIPQLHLQHIFFSQMHRTDLEEAFLLATREDMATLRYYHIDADSFTAPEPSSDATLKAHFESLPDSFSFADEGARLNYVRLALVPSGADSALMRDFAEELRERAEGGEAFAELARSYSSDAASAENGGRLPPAAAGEWTPAFAAAAFALVPGQISAPVLSPSGWHLIQLHAKTREGGVEKATVSHLLLTITVGTETVDSVQRVADALRENAEKSGLEAAAAAAGLKVSQTPIFGKSNRAPLGRYVQGLSHFAFSAAERKAKLSEPLQNDEGYYVLERAAMYSAGRDFDRARDAVAHDFARAEQLKAARAEAERIRPLIVAASSLPERIGKAALTTIGPVTSDGFAPGFGFANAALYQAILQKPGVWGPVIPTPQGAVIVQVTVAQPVPDAEKARRIRAARRESDAFQVSNLYQQWAQNLPKSARVKNRLAEVYRE